MPTIYHSTYPKPPLHHFNGHLQTILPTQLVDNHKFIHLETPLCGGHVGFTHSIDKEHTWAEHRAIEFALA